MENPTATPLKRKTKPVPKRKSDSIFTYERWSRPISFAADIITIGGILITGGKNLDQFPASILLSPALAFTLWFLAIYTYFAWLHFYWEANREQQKLHPNFGLFLTGNLILEFRSPFRLLPLPLLAILLFWIAVYTGEYLIMVIVGFVYFTGIVAIMVGYSDFKRAVKDRINKIGFEQRLNENWSFVEAQISKKLESYQWLDTTHFQDIATVWHINIDAFYEALARYALEHPDQTEYGLVYKKEDSAAVSGYHAVLISKQNLNQEKFFIGY